MMFSIYIHIPFCIQKCRYCDFLSAPCGEEGREAYVQALLAEITAQSVYYKGRKVDTVFFGGGTPSVLTLSQTERIMERLRRCFAVREDAEITTELNPGTVNYGKLIGYRRMGFNRLSIGLQSLDNRLLKLLGRIHEAEDFFACYAMARECGFENINVDVMSGLPGQAAEDYEEGLLRLCRLERPPEHLSAYSLIVEEGTPFYKDYGPQGGLREQLPDEEADRIMYRRTKELLQEYGYERYEISNYAKPGYSCRHNEAYWKRTDYAGFGLGAASMAGNVRWSNEADMQAYCAKAAAGAQVRGEQEHLGAKEQMEEFFFLGLRRMEGVSRRDFMEQFGISMEQAYGDAIRRLKEQGLLEENGERLKLTEFGTDISNYVFEQFLLD